MNGYGRLESGIALGRFRGVVLIFLILAGVSFSVVFGFGRTDYRHLCDAYRFPRNKMCFQMQGTEAYTEPAERSYQLSRMPYYKSPEEAAWWKYYVRSILV